MGESRGGGRSEGRGKSSRDKSSDRGRIVRIGEVRSVGIGAREAIELWRLHGYIKEKVDVVAAVCA